MKKTPGQPKKEDPRKHQIRMLLNDKEKALFLEHGLNKTYVLRAWLLKQIEDKKINLKNYSHRL
jgi:hypothetical protein